MSDEPIEEDSDDEAEELEPVTLEVHDGVIGIASDLD